jgi:hypothetical protein
LQTPCLWLIGGPVATDREPLVSGCQWLGEGDTLVRALVEVVVVVHFDGLGTGRARLEDAVFADRAAGATQLGGFWKVKNHLEDPEGP